MEIQKRNDPIQNYYSITEEVGRGSFSTVYKAVRKSDQLPFAVKVIDKVKLGLKKMEMIETEIQLMKTVKGHPNIINLEEVFETHTEVFIVMELISGGELFDKIVELQFYSEFEASKVVKQILSAIQHIHENKIVHRDLKPENLLLSDSTPDAAIKLADFGLSCFVPEVGKLNKAVGTPGYIAPEILQTLDEDLDGYSKEVDLWSVGVIMYILLCGFPPFYADDDDEAFDQIISGKFDYPDPYWTNISPSAIDLINHLLVVDANKRYTVYQALNHPWIVSNTNTTHLSMTLAQLKKFHARKKWKKGLHAVLALNKLKNLSIFSKKAAVAETQMEHKESPISSSPEKNGKSLLPKESVHIPIIPETITKVNSKEKDLLYIPEITRTPSKEKDLLYDPIPKTSSRDKEHLFINDHLQKTPSKEKDLLFIEIPKTPSKEKGLLLDSIKAKEIEHMKEVENLKKSTGENKRLVNSMSSPEKKSQKNGTTTLPPIHGSPNPSKSSTQANLNSKFGLTSLPPSSNSPKMQHSASSSRKVQK